IDYAWGGTLSVTVNRLPYLTRLKPNVYSAAGFSGHGISTATFAGKVMAEAIAGTAANFDVLADLPTHTFPGGTLLRYPGMVLGMLYFSLKDRL
ncbi:MAG: FAD-dependent oxidoreductase, partial [Woeseiaceae bacterium]